VVVFVDEGISTWSAYGFRDTSAFGLDDKISTWRVDGRSGDESARFDTGDMRAARSDDPEGARGERSSASVCVDTAPGNDKPTDTMVEGEDIVQVDGGISAFAQAVLGKTSVGARVFLLQ
jgi:hypothetical protein